MKIYISKHDDKIFLSDLAIRSDGTKLLSVGFPCFRFNLRKARNLKIQCLNSYRLLTSKKMVVIKWNYADGRRDRSERGRGW